MQRDNLLWTVQVGEPASLLSDLLIADAVADLSRMAHEGAAQDAALKGLLTSGLCTIRVFGSAPYAGMKIGPATIETAADFAAACAEEGIPDPAPLIPTGPTGWVAIVHGVAAVPATRVN